MKINNTLNFHYKPNFQRAILNKDDITQSIFENVRNSHQKDALDGFIKNLDRISKNSDVYIYLANESTYYDDDEEYIVSVVTKKGNEATSIKKSKQSKEVSTQLQIFLKKIKKILK